jgi:hypothetical protein
MGAPIASSAYSAVGARLQGFSEYGFAPFPSIQGSLRQNGGIHFSLHRVYPYKVDVL